MLKKKKASKGGWGTVRKTDLETGIEILFRTGGLLLLRTAGGYEMGMEERGLEREEKGKIWSMKNKKLE